MKYLLLFSVVWISACASHVVNSPEFIGKYAPPKTYAFSRQTCLTGTVSSLTTLNYKIRSQDAESGKIETERRTFVVNAQITSGKTATMTQLEQSSQLWIDVTGTDASCTVAVTKMRLWNGEKELETLASGGADWTKKNIVGSLYKEIETVLK